ncbi:MAG: hypothetical protein DWQ34_24235 [Planctomycetota bacterium]|nr:MAG: hypothetical protein DWQ29_12840 [Planctomycetota bacterium]REJ87758.1 MAG: hypothetical protein DWQ34_24235 [Planctomycetota bacterium]REK27841.1 MAG: hypothetical protein DWQ41_06985 [Planctomycetota bacterium]REK40295.1 MAG: hypothetical protein DWQ45_00225 [Planctomycetota bacterium]
MSVRIPFPLLTVRRMAALLRQPVSQVRQLLDEHPEIQPTATADGCDVYDRAAFLRLLFLADQHAAADAEGGGE